MPTYTPAEASAASGFSLDTLRYYEREDILPAVARTAGGHRAYSDADVWLLGFLRCLRDTGMPIDRLRRYGQLCADPSTLSQRVGLLEEHTAAVQRDIDTLIAQRERLTEKIAWYHAEIADSATA